MVGHEMRPTRNDGEAATNCIATRFSFPNLGKIYAPLCNRVPPIGKLLYALRFYKENL